MVKQFTGLNCFGCVRAGKSYIIDSAKFRFKFAFQFVPNVFTQYKRKFFLKAWSPVFYLHC